MEDLHIIELYFSRDEQAIRHTADKYGPYCTAVSMSILHSEPDAEECVNDTYLRAWNSIPPERPSCLSAWLARVARNAALDRIRYNAAACRSSALTEAFEELEPWLIAAEGDPQRELDAKDLRRVLNSFLRAQSPEARRFFLRRYWYGESVQEIAQASGVKESKVKTSLFRTRERLRKELEREVHKL